MYRIHNTVHIFHYQFLEYIAMLIHSSNQKLSSLVDNIAIDMHFDCRYDSDLPNLIDLVSILLICSDAPNLALHCGMHHCTCSQPVQFYNDFFAALLGIRTNAKLAHFLSEDVASVEFYFSNEKHVVVKKGGGGLDASVQ